MLFKLIFIISIIYNAEAVWWSLGLQSNLLSTSFRMPEQNLLDFCTAMSDQLTPGQAKLCELYSDHMPAVGKGARIGIVECQWQFRHSQWNCSTISNQTVFGTSINNLASREAAFVHAVTAAGVLQAIARSCRNGDIGKCSCSTSKRPANLNKDWIWGGCGDNVEYGYKFTKTFVDMSEKSLNDDLYSLNTVKSTTDQDGPSYKILERYRKSKGLRSFESISDIKQTKARRLINLHNNEAGRRVSYSLLFKLKLINY